MRAQPSTVLAQRHGASEPAGDGCRYPFAEPCDDASLNHVPFQAAQRPRCAAPRRARSGEE